MSIISVTAAAAAALAFSSGETAGDDAASDAAQCVFEPPMLAVDASVGPLLVSTVDAGRPRPAMPQGQWGQAALRPYDVMTSLGSGGSPALPAALSLADAPAPLAVSNPVAWVLACAGLLGMLYVRRTQL